MIGHHIGHHIGHRGCDEVGGPLGRESAEGTRRWSCYAPGSLAGLHRSEAVPAA